MSTKKNILILSYGVGNLMSIKRAIYNATQIEANVGNDHKSIENADGIILPGVGRFDAAMDFINSNGLNERIQEKALISYTPILGICLGMQLLCKSSEEGNKNGLGLVNGKSINWPKNQNLKIPNIGWGSLKIERKNDLLEGVTEEDHFYYLHSYKCEMTEPEVVVAKSYHGGDFTSVIGKENIWGVQFHPEKSSKQGLTVIKNFVGLI